MARGGHWSLWGHGHLYLCLTCIGCPPCRVSLCPQGCQLKYAEVLFHEMPSPGVRDYCAMLTLYRTFHRWRDAEHIYHKMVTHIAQGTHTDPPVIQWQAVVWRRGQVAGQGWWGPSVH